MFIVLHIVSIRGKFYFYIMYYGIFFLNFSNLVKKFTKVNILRQVNSRINRNAMELKLLATKNVKQLDCSFTLLSGHYTV